MAEFEIVFQNPYLLHPLTPLWLLPIAYIILAHILARRVGVSAKLKLHYPTQVTDWLFVPFNLGLVFFGEFVLEQIVLLTTISIAAMLWMNIIWRNNAGKSTSVFHRKGKLNTVGLVHTIFGVIQLVFVGVFLFTASQQTIWFYLSCASLTAFFILCIRNQLTQKLLRKDHKPEIYLHSIGILLILMKIAAGLW